MTHEYEYGMNNFSLADLFYDNGTPVHVTKHRLWPCFFWVTFVVGMFGNWLVVYVLLRKKNLRTVTNLYLLNLAIGDILYLVTTIPNTSYWVDYWPFGEPMCKWFIIILTSIFSFSHTFLRPMAHLYNLNLEIGDILYLVTTIPNTSYWPFGEPMCKLIHYMMNVTMSVTVLSVTAVGLDRHYAILYPTSSRQHRTVQKTGVVIVSFWAISFMIGIPAIFISKTINLIDEEVCLNFYKHPWEHRALASSMFVFLYLIPQLALGVCYYRIGKRLWFSMIYYNKSTSSSKAMQTLQSRRRVVKTVIVMTICFAVCWLPVHIVELYVAFGSYFPDEFHEIKLLAPLVPHLFISTNPIMYCFMSKTFRTKFKDAFQCKKILNAFSRVCDRKPVQISASKPNEMPSESDISIELANQEETEKTDFVDKAVNTSPRLKKHCRVNSSNCTEMIECVDMRSAV